MTTSLHDRLADLAADAPAGGPVPGLWDRARRYHRRRRAGTVAIAAVAVLALLALGTFDWWRARSEPTPAGSTPALPTRIWMPSPWLPGTDDAGPLGRLAAIQHADRRTWTGTDLGVAGISAATGEYRYLDLPDAVDTGGVLAPDGRRVAYWYTGDTRSSPNTESGPVVGVAVYDTTTGAVARLPVPTDHGLWSQDLVWADPDRLVLSYLQYRGGDADDVNAQSSATDDSGLLVWEPATGTEPVALPGSLRSDFEVEGTTGRGQLLLTGEGARFVDLDHPELATSFVMPRGSYAQGSAVDDEGTVVAWPRGNRNPNTIAHGPVVDGQRVDFDEVPDSRQTFAVWAWLDAQHVAAVQRVGDRIGPSGLMSVDVRTGAREEILRFPADTYGGGAQVATELLARPAVDRPEPPHPLDPRAVAGAAAVVVLSGLVALVWWRRRVRA